MSKQPFLGKNNFGIMLVFLGILFIGLLTACKGNKLLDYPGIVLALPNKDPVIDTVIWSSIESNLILTSGADYPSHRTNIHTVEISTLEIQTILSEEPGELRITSLSPDGKYILLSVVSAQSFPENGQWLLNIDDGSKKFLSDTPYHATWSPNGEEILYFSYEKEYREYRLHLTNFLTGEDKIIYTIKGYWKAITGPSWSPDGDRVVFSAGDIGKGNEHLFILDVHSSNILQLTDQNINSYPVWSPSGNAIAYISMKSDTHTTSIRLISPEGTCDEEIVEIVSGIPVTWSPDGGKLAFVDDALYVMEVDEVLGIDFPSEYCQDIPVQ